MRFQIGCALVGLAMAVSATATTLAQVDAGAAATDGSYRRVGGTAASRAKRPPCVKRAKKWVWTSPARSASASCTT